MLKNKKILLITAIGALILILIIVLLAVLLNKTPEPTVNNLDTEKLELQFNGIFTNNENTYVSTIYHIQEEKSGKYKIDAKVPYIHIDAEIDNKINKEINNIFAKELMKVINENQKYTILTIDYSSSINNNIMSLMIRCILKEGNNAQRTIIKTYNYDVQNKIIVNIMDIVPQEDVEKVQDKIDAKILSQKKREETIEKQGYKVYKRDTESTIYILENATEFYIQNNALYIIYSYGNSQYTSETDIIIVEI